MMGRPWCAKPDQIELAMKLLICSKLLKTSGPRRR
jgi:hypothetical protein